MRTETVELEDQFGKEYAGKYVFSDITWARRSRIIQKHTRYHSLTGQILGSDFTAIQAETIWASLREQPTHKPITLEKLLGEEDGIPIELGELLSKVANKLCGITADEQRFLSEPSEDASLIQRSPNSDSARSSAGLQHSSEGSQPKRSKNSS